MSNFTTVVTDIKKTLESNTFFFDFEENTVATKDDVLNAKNKLEEVIDSLNIHSVSFVKILDEIESKEKESLKLLAIEKAKDEALRLMNEAREMGDKLIAMAISESEKTTTSSVTASEKLQSDVKSFAAIAAKKLLKKSSKKTKLIRLPVKPQVVTPQVVTPQVVTPQVASVEEPVKTVAASITQITPAKIDAKTELYNIKKLNNYTSQSFSTKRSTVRMYDQDALFENMKRNLKPRFRRYFNHAIKSITTADIMNYYTTQFSDPSIIHFKNNERISKIIDAIQYISNNKKTDVDKREYDFLCNEEDKVICYNQYIIGALRDTVNGYVFNDGNFIYTRGGFNLASGDNEDMEFLKSLDSYYTNQRATLSETNKHAIVNFHNYDNNTKSGFMNVMNKLVCTVLKMYVGVDMTVDELYIDLVAFMNTRCKNVFSNVSRMFATKDTFNNIDYHMNFSALDFVLTYLFIKHNIVIQIKYLMVKNLNEYFVDNSVIYRIVTDEVIQKNNSIVVDVLHKINILATLKNSRGNIIRDVSILVNNTQNVDLADIVLHALPSNITIF